MIKLLKYYRRLVSVIQLVSRACARAPEERLAFSNIAIFGIFPKKVTKADSLVKNHDRNFICEHLAKIKLYVQFRSIKSVVPFSHVYICQSAMLRCFHAFASENSVFFEKVPKIAIYLKMFEIFPRWTKLKALFMLVSNSSIWKRLFMLAILNKPQHLGRAQRNAIFCPHQFKQVFWSNSKFMIIVKNYHTFLLLSKRKKNKMVAFQSRPLKPKCQIQFHQNTIFPKKKHLSFPIFKLN